MLSSGVVEPVIWDNTAIVGHRIAASRIGVDLAEYQQQHAKGNRWCNQHRAWLPEAAFYNPQTSRCRPCQRAYMRARHRASRSVEPPQPPQPSRWILGPEFPAQRRRSAS